LLESVEDVENFSMDAFHGTYSVNPYHESVKQSGFAFNKNLGGCKLSDIDRKTVLLFHADRGWNQNGTSAILPSSRYMGFWPFFEGGSPFAFIGPDSTFTVKFINNSEIDSLNWTPE
ncbi:MAG: hypothetical protein ACYTE1_01565, partial [Planctomycetota bacterium]